MSVLSGCIKIEVSIHKFVYKEGERRRKYTSTNICLCSCSMTNMYLQGKNIPSKKSATEKFKRKIKVKRINLTYMYCVQKAHIEK